MLWFVIIFVGLLVVLLIAMWRRDRQAREYPDAPTDKPQPPTMPTTFPY